MGQFGATALMHAIYNRDFAMVKYLVSEGADVHVRMNNWSLFFASTPLQAAIDNSCSEIAKFLIDSSADWTEKNDVRASQPGIARVLCWVLTVLNWWHVSSAVRRFSRRWLMIASD
jgi:ankyrin repeat protein